jgi:predicted RNase H-like HicB family nuclease
LNGVGIHSQGRTLDEARRNIIDAALLMFDGAPEQLECARRRPPHAARIEDLYVVMPR